MLNRRQEKMLRSLYGVAVRGQRANRSAVGIHPDMLLELIHLIWGNKDLARRVKEAEERLDRLGVGLDELANDPALPLFYKGVNVVRSANHDRFGAGSHRHRRRPGQSPGRVPRNPRSGPAL